MCWLCFVCYVLKQAPTQNLSSPDNSYLNINGTTAFLFGPRFLRAYLFQNSPVQVNEKPFTLCEFSQSTCLIVSIWWKTIIDNFLVCLWQDWVLATLLVRPLRVYSDQDMSNVLRLSTQKYGSVKRVFIISDQDKIIVPSFQRLMVTRNPPTEVQEIATSDHMVMMSRVVELSVRLNNISLNYK